MDLMVEASPRRVFANAHTYHINSISVNSDCETYLSADDLRINLWNLEITDRSFSILWLLNPCSQHLLEVFTEFIIVSPTDFTHLLWVFVIWHFSFQVVIVLGIFKCFHVVGVQFVQEKYETLAPF